MQPVYIIVAVIIILFLVYHYNENMDNKSNMDNSKQPVSIKLYEDFGYQTTPDHRMWKADVGHWIKADVSINMKSYHIDARHGWAEVWSVYPGSATASSEATGVTTNIMAQPYHTLRPPIAKKIVSVQNQQVKGQVSEPVKRVLVIAGTKTKYS